MNAAEFRAARKALGLSYGELGAILNVRADTIRNKWEGGKVPPSPMAVRVLEWMAGGFIPPEWPSWSEAARYNQVLLEVWVSEFSDHGLCGLCGNSGLIENEGKVFTPAGIPCGLDAFCICPNGRARKVEADG